MKWILSILLMFSFIACSKKSKPWLNFPNTVEMDVSDQYSGQTTASHSATASITITGDEGVIEWCLIEQESSLVEPLAPISTDQCFKMTRPTSIILGAFGKRSIYLYVKETPGVVANKVIRSEITFLANKPPVLNLDRTQIELNSSVVINPLENDADSEGDSLTIESIGEPSSGTAILNSDGTITYTPEEEFVGESTLEYTVVDARGDSTIGTIQFIVISDHTWVGAATNDHWSDPLNWCGPRVEGVCQGNGTIPGEKDLAYFNSTCSKCAVMVDIDISIDGINIGKNFTGSITQQPTKTITIGDLDWVQNGGSFIGGDEDIIIKRGEFILNNGKFLSTSGDLKLIEVKGGYATHDYFTISKTGAFKHNNGRVWFHIRSNNNPKHLIKITGVNNFHDVLVKRQGRQTDDAILSTESSSSRVIVEGKLSLENISILGDWEVQGNVYYGPQYGTYQGSKSAALYFTGPSDQTIEVDDATGFSEGDVVVNKSSGEIKLKSNLVLSKVGQSLDVQSSTTINMNGFALDVQNELNLSDGTVIQRRGGALVYGLWNNLGIINP